MSIKFTAPFLLPLSKKKKKKKKKQQKKKQQQKKIYIYECVSEEENEGFALKGHSFQTICLRLEKYHCQHFSY